MATPPILKYVPRSVETLDARKITGGVTVAITSATGTIMTGADDDYLVLAPDLRVVARAEFEAKYKVTP